MKAALRCAIYTRVSTEYGLDQEFNSLDNQREASEAYVKSQAHEGWRQLRDRYDDGGFSGGSTERPALQRLLASVREGRVDVIVVYKVDRLTRSLADFAKLVELFDRHGVSFVSVTQAFNTTTSMGRLTLNVLLSFAQFEREVTSERIRDKIAASKRRGIWVGGMLPLGYRVVDRKIVVVDEEAERVRLVFRRYLELGSLGALLPDLRDHGVVTKVRPLSTNRVIGGIAFTRGSLAYLLHNRFYIGEITFKGDILPAEHPAILDRALFDAVQAKLIEQRRGTIVRRSASGALLVGKLFDLAGNRMTPTHVKKMGLRYSYYINAAIADGRGAELGVVRRVPAPEIERLVVEAIRTRSRPAEPDDRAMLAVQLDRVDLGPDRIDIHLKAEPDASVDQQPSMISVEWQPPTQTRYRAIAAPTDRGAPARSMRTETRATLLDAIAKGRRWVAEMIVGGASPDAIAQREGCAPRHVTMTLSLAHLAPDIVEAAIAGRLPHGISFRDLVDPPAAWSRQRVIAGLAPRP